MSYNTSTLLTEAIEHLRTGLDRAQSTSSDMGRAEELSCAFENALPLLDALATPPEAAEAVGAVPASDKVLDTVQIDIPGGVATVSFEEADMYGGLTAWLRAKGYIGKNEDGEDETEEDITHWAGPNVSRVHYATLTENAALLARIQALEAAARLAAPPAAGEAGALGDDALIAIGEEVAQVYENAGAAPRWAIMREVGRRAAKAAAARLAATPAAADACEGQCGICSCIPSPPTATATPSND